MSTPPSSRKGCVVSLKMVYNVYNANFFIPVPLQYIAVLYIYVQVGLASAGDDAVKHASHCVS